MMYSDPEIDINRSKNPKSISGHKFQYNLVKGLLGNNVDLRVYNIQRIRFFPYDKKILIKKSDYVIDGKSVGIDIPYINIPFLNYFSQRVKLRRYLNKYILQNSNENIVLLVFNTHFIQSKVVLSLKRKYPRIITCNVVGDMYGEYGLKVTSKGLQKYWQGFVEKQQEKMQNGFDKYVLLSPAMREALGVSEDNCTVVEGFYDDEIISNYDISIGNDTIDKKVIFYAGSLKKSYGIEHLLRAFELIKKENYFLYVAGSGDGEELVKEYALKDNRIKYLGLLSPQDVHLYQSNSTVLISPRTSEETFVKYSFPSKTFECLASGKPYIAHRLPCEPDEYGDYIQYPRDESNEALSDEIVRVCEMEYSERKRIGEISQQFIKEKKNTRVMCKRICDLLDSCF